MYSVKRMASGFDFTFCVSHFTLFLSYNYLKLNNLSLNTADYVGPEYFCDCVEETRMLKDNIRNGRNTVLTSSRRMGKSGLIAHTFHQEFVKAHFRTFSIDLYPTSSLEKIFNNPSEPFYLSCSQLYLDAIKYDSYLPFAKSHFEAAGKRIKEVCFAAFVMTETIKP